MNRVPVEQRESYASVAAWAITPNVYLFAASNGLATVIRAWIDRAAIADALGLTHDQQVLLSQTVVIPRNNDIMSGIGIFDRWLEWQENLITDCLKPCDSTSIIAAWINGIPEMN